MLDDETKQFIINAILVSERSLIEQINMNFTHMAKRFDDVECRLEVIENRLNIMHKDTTIIPQIFGLLEKDGIDIAELENRINKLES